MPPTSPRCGRFLSSTYRSAATETRASPREARSFSPRRNSASPAVSRPIDNQLGILGDEIGPVVRPLPPPLALERAESLWHWHVPDRVIPQARDSLAAPSHTPQMN